MALREKEEPLGMENGMKMEHSWNGHLAFSLQNGHHTNEGFPAEPFAAEGQPMDLLLDGGEEENPFSHQDPGTKGQQGGIPEGSAEGHSELTSAASPANQPPGAHEQLDGMVPLREVIRKCLQKGISDFHELTEIKHQDPKKDIIEYFQRTRQLFAKTLSLVKWAANAEEVYNCQRALTFLRNQEMLFINAANNLHAIWGDLSKRKVPKYQIPTAIDILTTGSYPRLPAQISDLFTSKPPLSEAEKKEALVQLDDLIKYRILTTHLPKDLKHLSAENGIATFTVRNEFEVMVTLNADVQTLPWKIVSLKILIAPAPGGVLEGVDTQLQKDQLRRLSDVVQSKMDHPSAKNPLVEMYNCLHSFCLLNALELLSFQSIRLSGSSWANRLKIEFSRVHLSISYWLSHPHHPPLKISLEDDHVFQKASPGPEGETLARLSVGHASLLADSTGDDAEEDQIVFDLNLSKLNIETLLLSAIQLDSRVSIERLFKTISTSGHFDPKEMELVKTKEIRGDGQNVRKHMILLKVHHDCLVRVSVNQHTGDLTWNESQGRIDGGKLMELHWNLNQNPEKTAENILGLKFWTTYADIESQALKHGLTPFHKIPRLSQGNAPNFGQHSVFLRFTEFPSYFLAIELKSSSKFEFSLVSTSETPGRGVLVTKIDRIEESIYSPEAKRKPFAQLAAREAPLAAENTVDSLKRKWTEEIISSFSRKRPSISHRAPSVAPGSGTSSFSSSFTSSQPSTSESTGGTLHRTFSSATSALSHPSHSSHSTSLPSFLSLSSLGAGSKTFRMKEALVDVVEHCRSRIFLFHLSSQMKTTNFHFSGLPK